MDKILLDNMSGQELKEMIDDEIITLEDLDNTALEKILDFETDMLCFGTGDMTIIHRCSELLNERKNADTLTKESIISIICKAEKERVIIIDEEKTQKSEAKVIKRKNITLRKIGLVAAILTLMIATTTLVAAAFGVNILEYIGKIARQEEGSQIVVDDFTFYHNGESKQYSSIEEMIEEEKFNIMYPTKWPKSISIESIKINDNEHENQQVHVVTNDIYVTFFIEFNAKEPDAFDSDTVYKKNGMLFYIYQDDVCFATSYYDGNYYYVKAKNYDEVILIIDNLKG